MTDERLEKLFTLTSAGNRICPVPLKWIEFWKSIGATHQKDLAQPLILAGWSFSSDREKRDRFQLHIRYAAEHGLLDEVETFITSLRPGDWHTCSSSGLDWNYGDALAEDMREKEAHLEAARHVYQSLLQVSESSAFRREHLGATLNLYHSLFNSRLDPQSRIASLRNSLETYKHLGDDCDLPLWYDADQTVVEQIAGIAKSKQIELFLEQLLACAAASLQIASLGRAEIDEFLDDMWSA